MLIVLIVLWAIFTGRMGKFTSGVNEQDLQSQAAAANVGNTECDGKCFTTVGTKDGKWELMKVKGEKASACSTSQKSVGTAFSDLEKGQVCCISKTVLSSNPACS